MSRAQVISLVLVAALCSVVVAGCGDTSQQQSGDAYAASATMSAMRAAGWRASAVRGMPHTVSGTPQVAYLQTSTPAGRHIDVQFLKGPAEAASEGAAAEKQGFKGVVIGNTLAFVPPAGHRAIDASDRQALSKLLR